jgi:hypothetical protein
MDTLAVNSRDNSRFLVNRDGTTISLSVQPMLSQHVHTRKTAEWPMIGPKKLLCTSQHWVQKMDKTPAQPMLHQIGKCEL